MARSAEPIPRATSTAVEATEPDLTAFASLPREHWQKVWPSNPIKK